MFNPLQQVNRELVRISTELRKVEGLPHGIRDMEITET